MKSTFALLMVVSFHAYSESLLDTFGTGNNQFQIEFVRIGDLGNTADTRYNSLSIGSVAYSYNLAKYEISRGMIERANLEGGLSITLWDMSSRGGNGANRPATGVSWNEAARFVNYLNTSKGYQPAYNFSTGGANDNVTLWTSGQSGYNANNPYRNSNAFYFLPSLDEWYKGAYYDPNKPGGAGYWDFATGSNSAPTAVSGGLLSGTSVYGQSISVGPADITNAGGLSPYGTMAQDGNVYEWNESAFDGSNNQVTENRELRGGVWYSNSGALIASYRINGSPSGEAEFVGFRVASLPEPSALSLLAVGLGGLAILRRRRS